jgi:Xaa-Pro aminopeptidase
MTDYAGRIHRLEGELLQSGLSAGIFSPGPDLRYLCGYDAKPLERLTALIVRPGKDPVVLSPFLEREAALASPLGEMGYEVVTWQETENPFSKVAELVVSDSSIAVDGRMWADKLLRLQKELPKATFRSANAAIANLRMAKTLDEIESLRRAGAAIDWVHNQVASLLKVGRTEAEVGKDIADLIIKSGHISADFVIVGSGPNSASPHHEVSDRVIQMGDAIVVDIGGTMPDGYCSDSTRTYHMGTPTAEYAKRYEILHEAQQTATRAVAVGVPCEGIDKAGRDVMELGGIGHLFIHRIGHGIGLETHEEPYIVEGNALPLEKGFAFSIEPGFYETGVAGARIEDIVVCGDSGAIVLNNTSRELVIVE